MANPDQLNDCGISQSQAIAELAYRRGYAEAAHELAAAIEGSVPNGILYRIRRWRDKSAKWHTKLYADSYAPTEQEPSPKPRFRRSRSKPAPRWNQTNYPRYLVPTGDDPVSE